MNSPVGVTASGSSDIHKYHHLDPELVKQLVAIYRIMFPHNGVPNGFYEHVVQKLDDKAAQNEDLPRFLSEGIEALNGQIGSAWISLSEEAKLEALNRVVNGWSMNTDTMGVYGNYYLKRAIVGQLGLGANLPEDAIYPTNLGDESGKPLDGANKYTIHFDKGATPPAGAFWSITLYDLEGFQVANSLYRFAVSSWMPLTYNKDGSLDLYFQNESPGAAKEANWLPAPKGPFNLLMRLYAPKSEALNGKWNPPPVMRTQEVPVITTQ